MLGEGATMSTTKMLLAFVKNPRNRIIWIAFAEGSEWGESYR